MTKTTTPKTNKKLLSQNYQHMLSQMDGFGYNCELRKVELVLHQLIKRVVEEMKEYIGIMLIIIYYSSLDYGHSKRFFRERDLDWL